ncbi:hypothetical protein [Nocardioides sp. Root140]|nr:hypothetical protein [Nocardioides sp. Root140]
MAYRRPERLVPAKSAARATSLDLLARVVTVSLGTRTTVDDIRDQQ